MRPGCYYSSRAIPLAIVRNGLTSKGTETAEKGLIPLGEGQETPYNSFLHFFQNSFNFL
ncbi:hypothetical protein NVIE_0539 [Nitrososphaera viennensis EN76]|uniref:Uncharacterized protein n=1 Tax=Nitrososphaera viennensis EN76 TaxID=926571 RepID=A0A060HMD1_9ARCH|nr:hypothetical protein NVIE_0539 [Nitrososphaera viennensis EN76]